MRLLVLAAIVAATVAGCESEAVRAQRAAAVAQVQAKKAAEDQARAEQELFERRRAEVMAAPSNFLEISDIESFDKGFINSYRELTGVSITNRSRVPIRLAKGRAVWIDAKGEEVGAAPLTFRGDLAPGAQVRFTKGAGNLTSGTIQGSASRVRVEFTDLQVLTPAQL